VSNFRVHLGSASQCPPWGMVAEEGDWYAIHTKSRHEKWVAKQLEGKGIYTFLPLLQEIHGWSDRRSRVEVPMFSCYAFVRIAQSSEERMKILRTPGVLSFVGNENQGTPIPEGEIENLRIAIREKIACAVHPYIRVGQRVRVRGGSLDGIEGIIARQGGDQSLVLSVELLQRSISIRLEGYEIELVS
jgi:transcription antitermination factor NusG